MALIAPRHFSPLGMSPDNSRVASVHELDIPITRRLPAPFSLLPCLLRQDGFVVVVFSPSHEPPSVEPENQSELVQTLLPKLT